jgi:hypothetical protein
VGENLVSPSLRQEHIAWEHRVPMSNTFVAVVGSDGCGGGTNCSPEQYLSAIPHHVVVGVTARLIPGE